ncbi:hypothetical protein FYK55_05365 [Roseiconus nitratireducens]|uniref:Uncharacterized protein n=1 Tax=Roseiconus nitratireducens TaxID=2605748 RepID=A0A5M6DCK7_9BACT|nr:hypothetical protein [Roseiconus nitratireducens]KAA5545113.1 hypothetical protein FYK55_05365 [Roseiconus nitratireducens]
MTNTTARDSRQALIIRWLDVDGQVTLEPESQDRFTLRFRDVINACQMQLQAEEYELQFSILVKRLGSWLSGQTGVAKAYVTLRDSQLLFLVVTKSTKYDSDFEDALSDLDIELANDPDLRDITLSVLSIPNVPSDSLSSFMHPTTNFEIQRGGNDG